MDEGEEALWSSLSDDADVFAEEQIERSLLPPPIDEERSCKHCYVGDACMLFRKVRTQPRNRIRALISSFDYTGGGR